ncbi:hypothetical protein COV93_02250 [Candidatus Woesearchaeota archaeon CG11_big_fil_rev_8_21_14_0_20_43_8]|nr:MAG: hypothetical protein COV93_02250 [Candidatus Woesearchaeota archaeon CG11_big_fil_rev_8_21_14_0_20_43_8]PIO06715.1 MAG: hypothetical protein COT47_03025 [Candidatus Woesearchaeota archaeon CG08_land_8_20_14_0_20_43_7]
MKHLFVISRDEPELAKAEISVVSGTDVTKEKSHIIVIDTEKDIEYFKRLAYTKRSLRFLFRCQKKDLDSTIESFDWNSVFHESYLVRCAGLGNCERKIAEKIWDRLKDPKVDLDDPKTTFCFIQDKDEIYCGILVHESLGDFEYRRNKYKPRPHPTTMHPKTARFLINMSGFTSGRLLDPFCGAGGILIEGAVLGFDITGYDISQEMLNRCEENLYYFDIRKFTLRNRDAGDIMDENDLIVTDVPYGRNSKLVSSMEDTYKRFLAASYDKTKKMVVVFPHFVDFKALLGKWKIERELSIRCHGGLTRIITVLSK